MRVRAGRRQARQERVERLADEWDRDEAEMRSWLESLDDAALASVMDLGGRDRFPLWYFLIHILTHSMQQRRDAAILLTQGGHEPPELEFLFYADWLREQRGEISPD